MTKPENVEVRIRNARVKYAKVNRPGKPYDDSQAPAWEINIYPTDEDAELLKAHGVNPKEDKDGTEYWVAKRSTKTKAGADAKPPVVVRSSCTVMVAVKVASKRSVLSWRGSGPV